MISLLFDIWAIFVLLVLSVGVPGVLWWRRRQERLAEPKQRLLAQNEQWQQNGELNEAKFMMHRLQVCQICGMPTDPVTDIYSGNCWYHTNCYGKVN